MLVQSVVGIGLLGSTHILGVAIPGAVVGFALVGILFLSYLSGIAYVLDWRKESKGACRRPGADPLCATQHHG